MKLYDILTDVSKAHECWCCSKEPLISYVLGAGDNIDCSFVADNFSRFLIKEINETYDGSRTDEEKRRDTLNVLKSIRDDFDDMIDALTIAYKGAM